MRLTLSQLAVLVFIVSLTFFFGALILAFGLRIEQQRTWQHFSVPAVLWLGTAALLASSWVLERAKRSLKRALVSKYRTFMAVMIALAVFFLVVQTISAADLVRQGVAAAGNPHGSAFYVFMAIHAAHLTGGIAWMSVLYYRSGRLLAATETDLRQHRRSVSAAAIYWHFMGVLWLVMFLFLKRWTTE